MDDIHYWYVQAGSIFLIAGMLPLGAAMQRTGAASFIADQVMNVADPWGPWGVLLGLRKRVDEQLQPSPVANLMGIAKLGDWQSMDEFHNEEGSARFGRARVEHFGDMWVVH